jgi:peptide/nickel transport system permease protein
MPVILMISLLVFLLIHAAPGDPADLLLSDEASPQDIADARHRWGLDQPVYVQYLKFLSNILAGDLGMSFKYADPVITLIGQRLPATIELTIVSILIAVLLGVPLGVWAGAKPNSWADNFGSLFGFFGISMPSFWFGIMLILIVSGYLNLLPSSGRSTYGVAQGSETDFYIIHSFFAGNMNAAWDGIKHIIMPAIALGTNMMGMRRAPCSGATCCAMR